MFEIKFYMYDNETNDEFEIYGDIFMNASISLFSHETNKT